MRARAVAVAVLACLGAMLWVPGTALAHARYKSSTPGKGEVVSTSPSLVEITFTQDIQKVSGTYSIEVERDRGASVNAGPAAVDDADRSKMSAPLTPNLTPGRYVVHWTNVSDDDGDPLEGAFSFYVQTQPTAIDLENDAQLELIGAPDETPSASETAQPPVTAASTSPAASPTGAVATATATSSSSSDGGGNNIGIFIGIGAVAVVVIVAGGAALWYRNRRT